MLSQHSPHIGFEDIALDRLSNSKDEILPCHHFCDYRGQNEVRGCLVDSTETQREWTLVEHFLHLLCTKPGLSHFILNNTLRGDWDYMRKLSLKRLYEMSKRNSQRQSWNSKPSLSVLLNILLFTALSEWHEFQSSFQAQAKRSSNKGLTICKLWCLPISFPSL